MNKKERVKEIQRLLDQYFPDPPIPLDHKDAYTLLIAVLLSAQCTDARVNIVTKDLFKAASTPQEMIKLSIEDIRTLIKTCGLAPTKAKAIHRLSELLLENHQGEVPKTFEELENLPGVGHKTASVVMCQAFSIPAFPVDTHIFRAAHRWKLSEGKTVEQVEKDLKRHFPRSTWNKVHLQIIYFCRTYCPAKKHDPQQCPICRLE